MPIVTRKICLIGDFAVGKTSLVRRFVDREFSDQYLSTVGVKLSRKNITLSSFSVTETPRKIRLIIWDIEGETKFRAITPSYLEGAKGAIFVADVSRPQTIKNLFHHQELFLSINPKAHIAIALNKCDLLPSKQVETLAETTPIFDQNRLLNLNQTSAKTGEKVDQIFETLASRISN